MYKRKWQITVYDDNIWFDDDNIAVDFGENIGKKHLSSHTKLLSKKELWSVLDKLEFLGAKDIVILRYTYFLGRRWITEFSCNLQQEK